MRARVEHKALPLRGFRLWPNVVVCSLRDTHLAYPKVITRGLYVWWWREVRWLRHDAYRRRAT